MKEIVSNQDTVRSGFLDPKAPPAVEIDSGETVSYVNTWTHWGNEATYGLDFASREPLRHKYPKGPYSMNGPVVVKEVQPGDILEINLTKLRPISWGWNSFPLGVGALPEDFKEPYLHYFKFNEARTHTHFVKGVSFDLRPFLGVIGVEPAGEEETSAILAGNYGGNLVLPQFVVGATLFLPVFKPGGRLWIGNINAREGEGVVDQTGIETAAERLDLKVTIRKGSIKVPVVETEDAWYTFGFSDESLDDALVNGLRNVIDWLSITTDLDESEVYSLASMVMDFRVTQYANQIQTAYATKPPKEIHVKIPKNVFDQKLTQQINQSLRGEKNE
ncbi:acetamidase/formamidase family protein [Enterococcus sp. AZ103]|uniref:acetamidase/formamidase family protein n=1 Tax=Enterococcus sp. AZ103 TaxID=2774628 RepID=UPI003F1F68F0